MANIDLNSVQFWQPPSKPSVHKQQKASYKHGRSASTTSSRNRPAPLHNKAEPAFERPSQPKCAVTATRHQGNNFDAQPEGERAGAQGTITEYPRRACLIFYGNLQATTTTPPTVTKRQTTAFYQSKRSWVRFYRTRSRQIYSRTLQILLTQVEVVSALRNRGMKVA